MAQMTLTLHFILTAVSLVCRETLAIPRKHSSVLRTQGQETGADCRHRNLTQIPQNFPPNVTWINLSHNKISQLIIPQILTSLKHLDLSYNLISTLHDTSFKPIHNLEDLRLNHNNLSLTPETYPDDVFEPLRQLQTLHLHHNDNSYNGLYPETALGHLNHVVEIRIDTFKKTVFGSGFGKMENLKRLLLGFKGCKLTFLGNETFKMFVNVSIEVLDLDYCRIVEIEANAFWYLKDLQHLFVSHTAHLNPRNALISLYALRGRNISTIRFDKVFPLNILRKNGFEKFILSSEVLQYLKDVCVEKISMRNNQILWIGDVLSSDVTRFAKCIQHLDISDNDIYGNARLMFSFSMMPNLRYFDMSRHFVRSRDSYKNDQSNSLLTVRSLRFTLPPKLEYLNVTGFSVNGIHHLNEIFFNNARYLKEFRFSFNGVSRFSMRMHGLQNLSYLDFSGNTCGNMTPSFFDDFPGLSKLNMSMSGLNNPEDYLSVSGPRLLKPLKNLESLILWKNDLSYIDPNIFNTNPLKEIDLSHNRFENIPFDLQTTRLLHYLDLSFNSLTVLEESDMDLLDILGSKNNLKLNLKGNLLSCGCDNLDFVFWLYNTKVHLDELRTYSCVQENGTISKTSDIYQNRDLYWRRCSGKVWLSVSITCLAVFISVMTFIYILHWRKTMILNILLRLFGLNTLIKQPSHTDFHYDTFLAYSEHDCDFICDTVSELLEGKHKIRAFITDRDMLPGRSIPQEIVKAVDYSWRVVLVLTQNFLEDNWCRFITDYAVYVSTFRPTGCVLLVLFDDVRRGDIPPAVLNVVEERHIFNVKEYWGHDDALWRDVSCAIRCD